MRHHFRRRLLRSLPLLALVLLASCAGNRATSSTDAGSLLPGDASAAAIYPAMGKFTDSQQILLGEARGFSNGLIFIAVASEPQVVDAFFETWDGTADFNHDAFVKDLMRRDLMLLDFQACFMGVVRDDYDSRLKDMVPDNLKDETLFFGTMTCMEEHEDMGVLMVLDRDGTVKGLAGGGGDEVYLTLMLNGTREAFTQWSLEVQDDGPGISQGSSSSSRSADEPDT